MARPREVVENSDGLWRYWGQPPIIQARTTNHRQVIAVTRQTAAMDEPVSALLCQLTMSGEVLSSECEIEVLSVWFQEKAIMSLEKETVAALATMETSIRIKNIDCRELGLFSLPDSQHDLDPDRKLVPLE